MAGSYPWHMKSFLFAPRLRPDLSHAMARDLKRPFRHWMTGSLAVVMAALGPMRMAQTSVRGGTLRLLRHSRFDVPETVLRIESAARARGLYRSETVNAMLAMPSDTRTTLGSNALWQLAVLEIWLQAMEG